ncbi:Asp-tRNA(Asn)/Glu-tRNA(Gln) amidotransferase subunit GatB [candidate division KSB1 bacterium]|nr:Asp-tRNA(Asn)/Glu-tRNA(Gln) amidotransferase subunit GatB [candidate division KSB1 bacterium]
MNTMYEPVIGLEIHIQLLTNSKLFCHCSTCFGAPQNTQVCPVCLGMPGVLPVLNERAIEFGIRLALATHCSIAERSIFARKNYFYPDLPKGYQISQFEDPLCSNGFIEVNDTESTHRIRITRIHIEEDAGKSIHAEEYVDADQTLIDLNRCGVPLLELVTEPDIRSPQEAYLFLTKLKQLVQYLDICDGNMEQGSLRCDANISIRPLHSKTLGIKTELKNMNSFKGVEKALEFEFNRQVQEIQNGNRIKQVTLMWDDKLNCVVPMRSKEMAHDYRYFPDPDLVPVIIRHSTIDTIQKKLPELPEDKLKRFMEDYKLPQYDAEVLTESKEIADYFEAVAKEIKDYKSVSNWIMGDVLRSLNEGKITINEFAIEPGRLSELLHLIEKKVINLTIAKTLFTKMMSDKRAPSELVTQLGLSQVSDTTEISALIDKILGQHQKEVADYLSGKVKIFGFLVGQIMRESKGRANPQVVNEILKDKLEKQRESNWGCIKS